MKTTAKIIFFVLLFGTIKIIGQNNNDTIVTSYAVLRYGGELGGLVKSMTVTFNNTLPLNLKELLKNDKTPSKQIKGINSIADEYIFEGFQYLNKQGYQLVTSAVYYFEKSNLIREYIFTKKKYQ
jgi:hypothetical protein